MWRHIRDKYVWFHQSFRGSSVIFWSRLQIALGALYYIVSTTDASPFFTNPKYLAAWVAGNGFLTEYLRRSNAVWKDDQRRLDHDEDRHA